MLVDRWRPSSNSVFLLSSLQGGGGGGGGWRGEGEREEGEMERGREGRRKKRGVDRQMEAFKQQCVPPV